jgi:tripartite-type tricarboxylate transporter receptor subunit TctC
MKKGLLLLIAGLVLLSLGCNNSKKEETAAAPAAQETAEWTPEKTIQIVVPFSAGGNTDIPARIFAKYMDKYSEVKVEVINITGGKGGSAGAKEVQKADPDGYMLISQPVAFPMMHALGVQDFTYEDFEPVGQWLNSTLAFVVSADSPYNSMDDLIAAAKADPGQVSIGSVTGTLPFFAILETAKQRGVEFKMADLAQTNKSSELLGKRIDGYVDGIGAVRQFIDSGDFRCLGVINDVEVAGYEDIPTYEELGFSDYAYLKQVQGLWAPKGTPAGAIDYINEVMKKAAADPDCQAEFAKMAVKTSYMTVEDYTSFMKNTYDTFADRAKLVLGE